MIERLDCSSVSEYELNGLSLPTPYVDASVTGVVHASSCARAVGEKKLFRLLSAITEDQLG